MFLLSILRSTSAMMVAGFLLAIPAYTAQKPKEWNPVIDPANFVNDVNNPYFPLVPGTTMEYSGTTQDGDENLRIEVTHRHKIILGVVTRVVIETAAINGEVVEIAENWYAQDREGNVWYFGEFTQDFQDGNPAGTAGSWEAGVDDASPGIIMLAHPTTGETYFQEFAPDVAQDMATVMKTDETLAIPYQTFTGVLVTKEWSPLQSNSIEHKYYAPGIGLIQENKGADAVTLIAVH
jgi:hypothetical protein